MPDLQIRPMSRAELELGIDWAAQEGWNPGLHDGDTFHAADPGGFLLGLRGDGEPVGMVSAVRYGPGFGFLGFYIVRPAHRGQGHGWALWQAAMQRFGTRVVGLDGVVAQQDNYRKSGFALAWNNVRYQGRVRGTLPAPQGDVVPLHTLPLAEVLAYDASCFPAERSVFTQHWITQHASVALGVMREGRLAGWGVLRPCRTGHKIGPLFADDAGAAEALFQALLARVPQSASQHGSEDALVQIDLPAPNAAAVAMVRALGFEAVFETARMYAGPAPTLPIAKVFGVTTFELG